MHQAAPTEAIDLPAYLARIGLRQPVAPDLATLRTIVQAHAAAIPFENLDPFLGIVPALDLASVQRKLVHDGRGGYCFEQNLLLGAALREIGYAVTNLAARVLWGQSEDAITARSHMLLRVEVDGKTWLADVGFGGNTPTAPLRLVENTAQPTPHEPFRLHRRNDDWYLQVRIADAWQPVYRFDLRPQYPIDYMVSNWWLATRDESRFVTTLVASRAPAGRRLALRNREFTEHTPGGNTATRTLATAADIRTVLEEAFLIRLPASRQLDKRLAGIST